MKRMGVIVCMVFGLVLTGLQTGQAKDVKIGVVDFQEVLEQSKVFSEISSSLEGQVRAEEKTFSGKREALQKRGAELEKQKTILSPDVLVEKEEQLRQELKDLKRYANDKQEEFQRKNAELMQEVLKDLSEIVREIGEREGYTSIMERSTGGVVFFDSSMDITREVTKEYDRRKKK